MLLFPFFKVYILLLLSNATSKDVIEYTRTRGVGNKEPRNKEEKYSIYLKFKNKFKNKLPFFLSLFFSSRKKEEEEEKSGSGLKGRVRLV